MTRKGSPKVRTGCLTCKWRKLKCDEAKPACIRCTKTGRKCKGYDGVVPSKRAIARARSRTNLLKDALARARAGLEDGSEKATLEYFARNVVPKLPQNFENQFWTVVVPRMSHSKPAIRQNNNVDVVLSCCILFIATEVLRGCLDAAMQHLANGINILNIVDYDDLSNTTIHEVVPKFHQFSIIQLCFYDKPGFPSLKLQHNPGSRYNLGLFDKTNRIYLPSRAVDPNILDAICYIRSTANPGSQTGWRLSSEGPVMSEEQKKICSSFDRWHAAFHAFVDFPRKRFDLALPKQQGLICAETEMKCQTAKICISVCRSHDESVYDCFKELFRRIVTLAQLILDNCPDDAAQAPGLAPPPSPADFPSYKFDFRISYLPLLEFVLVKCRWLDIRYEAWLIVWRLATARAQPVTRDNLHLVGWRMIEREHNVKMDEVTRENASLFPLPAEEMRVKDYTADARFADLVTTAAAAAARDVDVDGGPAKVQLCYTQRLLLRCGSCELDEFAGWTENMPLPPPQHT